MQKHSKPPSADESQNDKIENETEFKSNTATHLEIAQDWQSKLAMKNAAILKSIEDLIDAALNNSSEN